MEASSGSGSVSGGSEISLPIFSSTEIMEMESIFDDLGEDSMQKELCLEVATGFSFTRSYSGEPVVTWQQVQNWFSEKQRQSQDKPNVSSSCETLPGKFGAMGMESGSASSCASKKLRGDSAAKPERSGESKGKIELDLKEMMYEARSAKENGWYDVALFKKFRYNKRTGELEVLVRFKGFGREEDEWVNVKRQVRKRSIPLVPSECHMVKVGDDVMSFRVTKKEAVYYDAHVVNIERNFHDTSDCSCVFEVRYDHNGRKEKVPAKKLCRRS